MSRHAKTSIAVPEAVLAAGRAVPDVIAVARDSSGRWFAYSPADPARDDDVFLTVTRIYSGGRTKVERQWAHLPVRSASRLTVVWSTERWATWGFGKSPNSYLTGPERESVIARLTPWAQGTPVRVFETFNEDEDRRMFTLWYWTGEQTPDEKAAVPTRDIAYRGGHGASDSEHLGMVARVARKHRGGVDLETSYCYTSFDSSYSEAVWRDADMEAAVGRFAARCRELSVQRDEERAERHRANDAIVKATLAQVRAAETRSARAVFTEEYGDAEDLWEGYLKRHLSSGPVAARILGVTRALNHAQDLTDRVGQTLTEAIGKAAGPYRDVVVVVPRTEG